MVATTDERGIRWLLWAFDPDPSDTTYEEHFAFILRDEDGTVRFDDDSHRLGLFSRADWERIITGAGFQVEMIRDAFERDVFVATK